MRRGCTARGPSKATTARSAGHEGRRTIRWVPASHSSTIDRTRSEPIRPLSLFQHARWICCKSFLLLTVWKSVHRWYCCQDSRHSNSASEKARRQTKTADVPWLRASRIKPRTRTPFRTHCSAAATSLGDRDSLAHPDVISELASSIASSAHRAIHHKYVPVRTSRAKARWTRAIVCCRPPHIQGELPAGTFAVRWCVSSSLSCYWRGLAFGGSCCLVPGRRDRLSIPSGCSGEHTEQ